MHCARRVAVLLESPNVFRSDKCGNFHSLALKFTQFFPFRATCAKSVTSVNRSGIVETTNTLHLWRTSDSVGSTQLVLLKRIDGRRLPDAPMPRDGLRY